MPEVSYYFDVGAVAWTDGAYMWDGILTNYAYTSSNGQSQAALVNTCPGTDLGTITKVELRTYAYGDGDDRMRIRPWFSGGYGDLHYITPGTGPPGTWSAYVDITNDTNAPSPWTWGEVSALKLVEVTFFKVGKGGTMYCAKVEIRVTYGLVSIPTVSTQAVTDITPTTATGHGTIVATGGENCSKRGICWNTTGNPTVADDKSEETDSFGEGAFSRPMTGLIPVTHYYVKAYAYNSEGYGYGNEVEFDSAWEAPVSDIDVGADPIVRITVAGSGFTRIGKDNPANASGILHTVKVWTNENITGLIVGTFYTTNGNTLKCRDSELIGDVEAGAERTFTGLSIDVQEGDYIGCYFTAGYLWYDASGFAGVWYISGEYIDPGDEATYGLLAGDAFSLYGYGDIEAPPEVGLENKSANMGSKMVGAGLI